MAVQEGQTERAVVPIENSLEGGVAATLDALAGEADGCPDRGRGGPPDPPPPARRARARPRRRCERVLSHPQATAQCARFLREQLPQRRAGGGHLHRRGRAHGQGLGRAVGRAGLRLSAELYGCVVLAERVEDHADNLTRFVWLAHADSLEPGGVRRGRRAAQDLGRVLGLQRLVARALWSRCSASSRAAGSTSPRSSRARAGCAWATTCSSRTSRATTPSPHVAEALDALRGRVETLRVLGSYPAWPA